MLTAEDRYLFNEGSHFRLYEKLGAHPCFVDGKGGTNFAVWAPDAVAVSVVGDFNGWQRGQHPLTPVAESGIWQGFVPQVGTGALYKYHIASRYHGSVLEKADPFAFATEVPPRTASRVWSLAYAWGDERWMKERSRANHHAAPLSIYEVHLGSWMRIPEEGNRSLTYRELAPKLSDYVARMGFTHVEFLPVMEHPFGGSWGYQTTSYFAPTSRFGTPQDFMFLIDHLHQRGIGVILDWVPSHFPNDAHGLGLFDGTHLYEHADPRLGFHPDWKSFVFNYGRKEVQSFLISSALFWLERYHADGLRVDAVASMLYRDYSRKSGEWLPNSKGGNENEEAIALLRRLNEEAYRRHPDIQMIAEESTAWPKVSRPTSWGGLGFGFKWDMGWMHDTLQYLEKEPIHRKYHYGELTFRMIYAFHEHFLLPLSHDEVVHGKGSLLDKMPGDPWQQCANLRLLYGYLYGMPGKKLLFMGGEFAQVDEWHHDRSLDWHLLAHDRHRGVQRLLMDLNRLYRTEKALHELDGEPEGFEWVIADDWKQSVIAFLRYCRARDETLLVVCNFTPVPREHYRIGVPTAGRWQELLNSDAKEYGGSGWGNQGGVTTSPQATHGHPFSLDLVLPPLGVLFLKAP